MSAERRKVLEMLAAGKITPEEAERILNRLASPARPENAVDNKALGAADSEQSEGRPKIPRFFRVVVDSPDGDGVDIRLPIGLIRTGLKLSTLMPGRVSNRLSERGIDLSHLGELDDEALIKELAALQIDVDAGDGESVRIFCE